MAAHCGFIVNDKGLAASVLRAAQYLEQVRQLATGSKEPMEPLMERFFSMMVADPALRMLIDVTTASFGNDAFVAEFCRTFLEELFMPKEQPEKFDRDSMAEASKQIKAAFAMLPGKMSRNFKIIDGNAGYGDYLIAVIELFSGDGESHPVLAYEANPVAYQVARLRTECALKARKTAGVSVFLRNLYTAGIAEQLPGACAFIGEMKPHLIKGASLEVNRGDGLSVRYGWGRKLQHQDQAIAGMHLPFPGIGTVKVDGPEGFSFQLGLK